MRVLIADDHDLLRDTLIAFLSAENDMELGSASSFDEAKERIREDAPYNLILLDYKMPGMKGLESLSEAIAMEGGQRVALISGQATREVAEEALGLGAAGFVPKTLPAKSLVNAVKFMAMGEQYAPVDFMKAQDEEEPHAMAERLTKRELEVLKGLTEGKSNKAIARDLDLTEPTIKLHMKTLFRKLEVNNRTQAAIVARDVGLF
ncbi:MAG: response regulator transcription factor [Rhodobacteraceae bacterium]|nr:response regulator transcription factor [Paracoccaceae bacterium]